MHGWTLSDTLWLAGVWAVFQAGVAFPAGKLREKDILPARTAMLLGAVCSGIGYLTIAHTSNMVLAYIGYSVFGGTGAGLVYATCINMVGTWYPEKRGARTGFVNGGFAYGTIPFIFVFAYVFNPGNFSLVFDLIAVYMLVVVAWCGFMFKDPPKNWWPAQVDPLTPRGKAATSLAKNPPAVRQFTPMQAIKTGMLPLMWVCLVLIGGVSLFGINTQAVFAKGSGFGPALVAFSAALLAFVNGVGRGLCGWLSDALGRKQTLTLILVIAAIGQFGVLYAGNTGSSGC